MATKETTTLRIAYLEKREKVVRKIVGWLTSSEIEYLNGPEIQMKLTKKL